MLSLVGHFWVDIQHFAIGNIHRFQKDCDYQAKVMSPVNALNFLDSHLEYKPDSDHNVDC